MKIGVDTTFLIAVEIYEHPGHTAAEEFLYRRLDSGDTFALTGQVMTEFLQVVADPERFEHPLLLDHALSIAQTWWNAAEVVQVYPDSRTQQLFFEWMRKYELGPDRIQDALCVAVYAGNGISSIVSMDAGDFDTFDEITVILPDS